MKPKIFRPMRTAAFSLLAICLGSPPTARAQQDLPAPGQPGYQPVEVLTPQAEAFALGNLAGKPVRGSNHEQFGTVADFLVEPQSGRVHFVVVPSGSNTFRLLPMAALQQNSGTAGVYLTLDRGQWEQLGTMTADQLQGPISIDAEHLQRIQQQFALSGAGLQPMQGLLRASSLRGREVRAGADVLGRVEDVVIDFHNKIAAPLVRTASGQGMQEQRLLIHFPRLHVDAGDRSPIMASLGRSDLQPLRGQMTPTGPLPGGFLAQNQQHLNTAAMAIQQAVERNASVPRGSVHVYPESRIVLRGYVDSEQKKAEAERAAQQAAPGMRIENQITVRNW